MNWLTVGAVGLGGIVVLFVLKSVVHLLLGLLTAIAFVAIVAGGAYVAYKIAGARRRRQVKSSPEERRVPSEPESRSIAVPTVTPKQAVTAQPAHHDVEDELARLKREMGG